MPSKKVKVFVEDLAVGMYVSELDRPWLGSPFLFQGFLIRTDQELRRLRRHCRHVYVDVHLSREFKPPEYMKVNGAPRVSDPPVEAVLSGGTRDLRRALVRDFKIRQRSRNLLESVFQDVRMGRSVAAEGAKEIVRDLVDSIAENANAALWLTNLKNKDEYTLIHSMNVCVLAIAFARHLGFGREALEFTGLGALLHDVGKMRVPDEILNKPGPLTAEEFEIMRRHPVEGYEMVRECEAVPAESLEIVRFHHERVNSAGYPDGLPAESIPDYVLVAAAADVYDALTSDRCYRDGMSAPAALKLMYELAERDLGKSLVEAFIKCLGIYPTGSLVELRNGGLGIVLSADQKSRLRPTVMLVREASGEPCGRRRLINLAAMAELDSWDKWAVRGVVDPKDYGIDLPSIIQEEARLDQALA